VLPRASQTNTPESQQGLLPGFLVEHASCAVSKVGQAASRLIDANLQSLGIRARHYQVLKTLAEKGATSQQTIGELLHIDRATMVATIDDLESLNFVQRRRNKSDRRAYAVHLTPPGRSAVSAADDNLDKLDAQILSELSPTDQQGLHAYLCRLVSGKGLAEGTHPHPQASQ
jgi:DNA-binding MarR family transcriptional regulator